MQLRNLMSAVLGWCLFSLSTSAYSWVINDNYDNQSVGQDCGVFWQSQADSKVTNQRAASGSQSCKMRITQGNKGWGGGFVFPSTLGKGNEYWMRFRLFIPQGFDWSVPSSAGGKLKFIRITKKDSGGTPNRMGWSWKSEGSNPPFAKTLERDNCTTNCWEHFGSSSDKPVRGVWETYEIYVKFDTTSVDAGGTGRTRAWKNGKLIGDLTNRPTMANSFTTAVSAMIFSYWNGGSPATQEAFLDDLVATNVRPTNTDANGNPYIGVGNFVAIAPPLPPSSIN